MPEEFSVRLAHQCFPQPDKTSRWVWRYMPLAKLVSMLLTRKLFMCRLDLLSDTHEGSTPRALFEARAALFKEHGLPDSLLEHLGKFTQKMRNGSYVNCWCLSDYESEALWRLYGTDSDGVAIRTTYQALVDVIRDDDELYIGKVTYIDYETEWFPNGNAYYAVMHKRRAFAHEQEVRLVRAPLGPIIEDQKNLPLGIEVPIDVDKLVQALYISPYCPEWYSNTVRAVVERFAPALSGRIIWSPMKAIPLY